MAVAIFICLAVSVIAVGITLINNWWCKRTSTKFADEVLLEFNRYGPEYSSKECPHCHAKPYFPCYYIGFNKEIIKEIELMRIHPERVGIVSYEKRELTLHH